MRTVFWLRSRPVTTVVSARRAEYRAARVPSLVCSRRGLPPRLPPRELRLRAGLRSDCAEPAGSRCEAARGVEPREAARNFAAKPQVRGVLLCAPRGGDDLHAPWGRLSGGARQLGAVEPGTALVGHFYF